MHVNNRIRLEINEENYGVLTPYIMQNDITDLDYNGRCLWIGMTNGTRRKVANIVINKEFVEQFSHRIANLVNQPFNQSNVLLEAETDFLRISILHESVAISGRSISIRKSPVGIRMSEEEAVAHHFCDLPVLNFLVNSVIAHQNIVFCGEPGVGTPGLQRNLYLSDGNRAASALMRVASAPDSVAARSLMRSATIDTWLASPLVTRPRSISTRSDGTAPDRTS